MKVLQIKESRLKLFGCSSKLVAMCNVLQSVKTKETNPTRPGSPTPCKQALKRQTPYSYTLSLWRNCRICLPNILFPVFMFAFIFHCRSFFFHFAHLVILHWHACGADGRSLGRSRGVQSRDYQIFSDG